MYFSLFLVSKFGEKTLSNWKWVIVFSQKSSGVANDVINNSQISLNSIGCINDYDTLNWW